jgi:hypothetical protein
MKKLICTLLAVSALSACNSGGSANENNPNNTQAAIAEQSASMLGDASAPSPAPTPAAPKMLVVFQLDNATIPTMPPIALQAVSELVPNNGNFKGDAPYVVAHAQSNTRSTIMQNDPVANYFNSATGTNHNASYWEEKNAQDGSSNPSAAVFVGYGPDGKRVGCNPPGATAPTALTVPLYPVASKYNIVQVDIDNQPGPQPGPPGYTCHIGAYGTLMANGKISWSPSATN